MKAKEFLQQAYFAQQEIDIKLEQISRLQALATQTTRAMKSTPSSSGISTSKIEEAVVSIQEQGAKLAEEIKELLEIIEKVSGAISQIKNPVEGKILKYRYVCFFSWKQIALMMKTSQSNIFKLHNSALKNFAQCSKVE